MADLSDKLKGLGTKAKKHVKDKAKAKFDEQKELRKLAKEERKKEKRKQVKRNARKRVRKRFGGNRLNKDAGQQRRRRQPRRNQRRNSLPDVSRSKGEDILDMEDEQRDRFRTFGSNDRDRDDRSLF